MIMISVFSEYQDERFASYLYRAYKQLKKGTIPVFQGAYVGTVASLI